MRTEGRKEQKLLFVNFWKEARREEGLTPLLNAFANDPSGDGNDESNGDLEAKAFLPAMEVLKRR